MRVKKYTYIYKCLYADVRLYALINNKLPRMEIDHFHPVLTKHSSS